EEVPIVETRMVYTVNEASAHALTVLAGAPRIGELAPKFSRGWDESIDRRAGRFDTSWGMVGSWWDAILQGPHFHVGVPFYKAPNETMRNNLDWSDVDLESLEQDALPITSYKPTGDRAVYDASYTQWGTDENPDPARNHYRVAWRAMAANTGERTLIPAIIPPGTAHIHGIHAAGLTGRSQSPSALAVIAGVTSSLLADFSLRVAPKAVIYGSAFERLPFPPQLHRCPALILRALRLNCLTDAYSDLWESVWDELAPGVPENLGEENAQGTDTVVNHPFTQDEWTGGIDYPGRPALGDVGPKWTPDVPLRRESDRRQALVEIDVLVA